MNKEYRIRVTAGDTNHRTTLVNQYITEEQYLKQNVDMLEVLKFAKDIKQEFLANGDYTVTFDGGEYRHYTCEDSENQWLQVNDVLYIGYTRTKITKYVEF